MITVSGRHPSVAPGFAHQGLVVLVVGADVMDLCTVTGDRVLDARFQLSAPSCTGADFSASPHSNAVGDAWPIQSAIHSATHGPFTGQLRAAGVRAPSDRHDSRSGPVWSCRVGCPTGLIWPPVEPHPHIQAATTPHGRATMAIWGLTNAGNGCQAYKLIPCVLRACATTGRGPAEDRQNVSRTQTRPWRTPRRLTPSQEPLPRPPWSSGTIPCCRWPSSDGGGDHGARTWRGWAPNPDGRSAGCRRGCIRGFQRGFLRGFTSELLPRPAGFLRRCRRSAVCSRRGDGARLNG
jgi:hypothetical protein